VKIKSENKIGEKSSLKFVLIRGQDNILFKTIEQKNP
jgi:hypothetical protein